jgi:Zn-dependent M32 family carboxypeptidase
MGVPQLVEHATGRPPSAAPFLRYLERKYLSEA